MSGLFKKLIIVLISFALFSCTENAEKNDKTVIAVTIAPYKNLVEKIAGNKFNVISSIPVGATPHHFEPSPNLVQRISDADYYFAVGKYMEFETVWLEKVKGINKNLRLINLSANVNYINKDPHIWLSTSRLKIIAKSILDAVTSIDSTNKDYYQKNFISFNDSLNITEHELQKGFEQINIKTLLTYHGSWEYFCDDFGFNQLSIESGSKTASANEFKEILYEVRKSNVPVIFIDPQHSRASAEVIANDLNIPIAVVNPLPTDLLKNFYEIKNEILKYYK